MITEIVEIDVVPGTETQFEAAVGEPKPLFDRKAVALSPAGKMGQLGGAHDRLQRLGRFSEASQAPRRHALEAGPGRGPNRLRDAEDAR